MIQYIDTPLFGVGISILVYTFSSYISGRLRIKILNPLLLTMIIIVGILLLLRIDYDIYNKGGQIISFFLGPATVVLAVPLYKQINLLKENLLPILTGILVGSISGIISILGLGKLFNLDLILISSLIPKSTTTPIAMEISTILGGNSSLTVTFVVITGLSGYIIGEKVLEIVGIKEPIAKGIALGTASHAIGTAKAIEMGEVEGAMSSLSIGVAGIITVFLVPLIIWLIGII
ncbi:MAG TPA: LrgB family protein [Tissierellaceae bacterium]|nr:LrgB family protein [Tissierellaceae bacterium]